MATTTRPRVSQLADLRLDEAIQPRAALDLAVVDEYAAAMAAGAEFPPVVIFDDGAVRWLVDGFHRVKAAERLGTKTLPSEIHKGSKRDATLYAVSANQTHGLRRTNADKRKVVLVMLHDGQWKRWSDREIARRCGVTHPFVESLRKEASGNGYQMESKRTVERNGQTYEMNTAAIGKRDEAPVDAPKQTSMAVHFSSETPEHYTPQDFLTLVRDVFGDIPDLDPCSNSAHEPNVKARAYYTAADDGLQRPWGGRVFMNPPYGREIGEWVAKLRDEWRRSEIREAIALLPARTDTEWFDTLTAESDDLAICFLRGRLTFVGNSDPAPFPSMAVYLGPHHDKFADVFLGLGSLWVRPPRGFFVSHE